MKKSLIITLLSVLVLVTTLIWLINSSTLVEFPGIFFPVILLFVIGFGIFIGVRRIRSIKSGQPAEDELSLKIMNKASSASYYISIYLWLLLMYLSDKSEWEPHSLIGAGILGMAIILVLCWIFFKMIGLKNV
jgi:hypothetical protein